MAAHIREFLLQMVTDQDLSMDNLEKYQYAINYARVGDQFEFDDWLVINDAQNWDDILLILPDMFQKYNQLWLNMGCPRTWEDWMERQKEATTCPECGVESASAQRFAVRIWAGCGHFEVIKGE